MSARSLRRWLGRRAASPAPERTDQLCAIESIWHSGLLADPGGEPAGSAGLVSHFQHRKLDRCVHGHVHPQFRADAALRVLKDTEAESVPTDVRLRAAAGAGNRTYRARARLIER